MAVYKVIQDIEAEDKLLGPLTLKGFIYAGIAGTCAYIEFRLLFIGTPLKYPFILLFAIPMLLFGVLASPLGREQPTEVWLLSKIRFFFKPRKRIWDQSGLQELVTITAPKKEERQLTKNLSQNEVQSRLKTLALTLDTRGWAVKNVNVNLNETPKEVIRPQGESDRLVGNTTLPREMPVVDVHAADDILDEQNNPTAQKFASLMKKADTDRKKNTLEAIRGAIDSDGAIPKDKSAGKNNKVNARLAKARAKFVAEFEKGHKKPNPAHKIVSSKIAAPKEVKKAPPTRVTAAVQAVNMELAQSGSAFSVATLSQLANRQPKIEQTGPNEITISLH